MKCSPRATIIAVIGLVCVAIIGLSKLLDVMDADLYGNNREPVIAVKGLLGAPFTGQWATR